MKKATPEERKFSKPEYGGTMNLRIDSNIVTFDPNAKSFNYSIMSGWLETLHAGYWPLEPVPFDQKFGHLNYTNCHLAESWEFSEPGTYVVHLRKGIHWQNIPPVNGRELTSDDVAYHYHRLYGGGPWLYPTWARSPLPIHTTGIGNGHR